MFRREVLPPLEIQRKPPRDRGSMKKGDCDTMKKFLALILTLAMALSVTACGGSDDTADDTADGEGSGTEETADYASMTDDELKAAITTVEGGKLTVATSPDFAPPYEFYAIDENGDPQLAGFDMDLAQYIADYLGLSLEIVPMDFDGTIMELQNGNVDLGMAGYSPIPSVPTAWTSLTFTSPAASPLCAWSPTKTCSPLWRMPTMPTIRSALRWAPSRRIWRMRTYPGR